MTSKNGDHVNPLPASVQFADFCKHDVGNTVGLSRVLEHPGHTDVLSVLSSMGPNISTTSTLFGLILYVPVNNFSVMSGRIFLG